jgi:hypothetical protein
MSFLPIPSGVDIILFIAVLIVLSSRWKGSVQSDPHQSNDTKAPLLDEISSEDISGHTTRLDHSRYASRFSAAHDMIAAFRKDVLQKGCSPDLVKAFKLKPPTVVFSGIHNSGTSTIVSVVSNFPEYRSRGAGDLSCCPVKIKLRRGEKWGCRIKVKHRQNEENPIFSEATDDAEKVGDILEKARQMVRPPYSPRNSETPHPTSANQVPRRISDDILVIQIDGAQVDVTFIDLPGCGRFMVHFTD